MDHPTPSGWIHSCLFNKGQEWIHFFYFYKERTVLEQFKWADKVLKQVTLKHLERLSAAKAARIVRAAAVTQEKE